MKTIFDSYNMSKFIQQMLRPYLIVCGMALFSGCIDESPTPVVFDQVLQSTTFRNQLLTKVVLFRNGAVLDTLGAQTSRSYVLGKKGVFTHAWRIVAPLDNNHNPAGIEPYVDLNVQYAINAEYTINNESVPSETIFTPRIANLSVYDLRLTVNWNESDQFQTNFIIPRSSTTSLTNAPYYYWNSSSNVRLDGTNGPATYIFSRDSTQSARELRLDDSTSTFKGAGATIPVTPY